MWGSRDRMAHQSCSVQILLGHRCLPDISELLQAGRGRRRRWQVACEGGGGDVKEGGGGGDVW